MRKEWKLQAQTTIHTENLPGNKMWPGGKEHHRRSHILRGAIALHRSLMCKMLIVLGDLAIHNHARGYAIHADLWSKRLRHGLSQHVQSCLRSAVVCVRRPRM